MSAPVRSPFGWHIIVVEERRTQDVTQERRRDVARNAIRAAQVRRAVRGIRAAGARQGLRRIQDRRQVSARRARLPCRTSREPGLLPLKFHHARADGRTTPAFAVIATLAVALCVGGYAFYRHGRAPVPEGAVAVATTAPVRASRGARGAVRTDDDRLSRQAGGRGRRRNAHRDHRLGARSRGHRRRRRARRWRAACGDHRHRAAGRRGGQARISRFGARGIRVRGRLCAPLAAAARSDRGRDATAPACPRCWRAGACCRPRRCNCGAGCSTRNPALAGRQFNFLMMTSGASMGGADETDTAYAPYLSRTQRVGIAVPLLYMRNDQGRRRRLGVRSGFRPEAQVPRPPRRRGQPARHHALRDRAQGARRIHPERRHLGRRELQHAASGT